jgi:hypothetical protein
MIKPKRYVFRLADKGRSPVARERKDIEKARVRARLAQYQEQQQESWDKQS